MPVVSLVLQNGLGFEIGTFTSVNWIQVVTLLGVAATIIISYTSLNQQRTAAARESLEQLDDLEIRRPSAKIKPILHKYRAWPRSGAVVKLQFYQPSNYAGVSQIHSNLMAFPRHVFEGYDASPMDDGYLIQYETSSPVEIRRMTQDLFRRLSEVAKGRDHGNHWIPLRELTRGYNYHDMPGKLDIHKMVTNVLHEKHGTSLTEIQDHLEEEGFHRNLARLSISDLIHHGSVQADPDNKQSFILAPDPDSE